MNPEACTTSAAAYARTATAITPMANRADEVVATTRRAFAPQPPHREADDGSSHELGGSDDEDVPPRIGCGPRREPGRDGGHEEHDGGVVEAGLGLEQPGDPAGERHGAQDGEDGCGIRRREHGGDEQCDLPRPAQQHVGGDPHDQHGHRDPHRREHRGRRDRPADAGPPGGEPALDEDEDEGGVPEHLGQLLGVVADAGTRLPEREPDSQVDEQRRESGPQREPHRRHRDDEDKAPHQEGHGEVVERESAGRAVGEGQRPRLSHGPSSCRRSPVT